MAEYKRIPTYPMFISELMKTIVKLQGSDKDSFQPAIYLSPTGAEVSRVLITGTAIDKEDVGSDGSFQRVRIVDPTGAVYVYAGQYQPEAAIAIRKLNMPCFVMVTGKISHYTPEAGKDTIISLRAETIAAIDNYTRDIALVDVSHHTAKRLIEAQSSQRVKENYSGFDFKAFAQMIDKALDQVIENPAFKPAVPEAKTAAPEIKTNASEPPKPSVPESKRIETSTAAGHVNNAEIASASQNAERTLIKHNEDYIKPGEAKPEDKNIVAETKKPAELDDAQSLIYNILKSSINIEQGVPKESLQNTLIAMGYGMLNVSVVLEKLKASGYVIEVKKGFFKAV